MTSDTTLALAGATGGAGTTRLTVEFGATLARAGRDVALFDAALGTQGLARHVPGRLDPDLTGLLVDRDRPLDAALYEHPTDLPGRLAACPARAPFQRLARAKTPAAAQRLASLFATAAERFDHVLVDVPPVAANPAVAAVSAADRVAIVAPGNERGQDLLPAMQDRLYDVGAPPDAVVANRTGAFEGADATVPESDASGVAAVPACADPDGEFAPAVARAVETCLGTTLDLPFPEEGLLDGVRG